MLKIKWISEIALKWNSTVRINIQVSVIFVFTRMLIKFENDNDIIIYIT